MKLLDCFERIRIVNLHYRSDRRREMDRELRKIGLFSDSRVQYFPAIRPENQGSFTSIGARGVYLSQQTILREAAKAGESVLILEDDCEFSRYAGEYESKAPWDIFYGGWFATDLTSPETSDIIGAHMMGFSIRGARKVSAYLDALEPDCEIHPPIDAAYVWYRRANPNIPTLFANPPLAGQRSSQSDIAPPKWHHRLPFGRPLGKLARKILNQLSRR